MSTFVVRLGCSFWRVEGLLYGFEKGILNCWSGFVLGPSVQVQGSDGGLKLRAQGVGG